MPVDPRPETKSLIPVIIKNPHQGDFDAQKGTALAIEPDASRHIIVEDVFHHTGIEKLFKNAKEHLNQNKHALNASLGQAINVISPQIASIHAAHNIPIVINSHGRASRTLLALAAKCANPESFLVNLSYPRRAERFFDLLALTPADPVRETRTASIRLAAVPNSVHGKALDDAEKYWRPILGSSNKESLAIIVGGTIGQGTPQARPFTLKHGRELVEHVLKIRQERECDLFLTTSRRTPPKVVQLLKNELGPLCFHSYFPDPNKIETSIKRNPFKGYMKLACAFLVTADSMSMLSQAIDSGKPVYGFCPEGMLREEHLQLYKALVSSGHVKPLPTPIEFGAGRPIHAAARLAETIAAMVKNGCRTSARIDIPSPA